MGLLDKLISMGSTLTMWNGSTPSTPVGATDQSKLHDTYSLDGIPPQPGKPEPSQLDLDGKTPSKYLDNPPM